MKASLLTRALCAALTLLLCAPALALAAAAPRDVESTPVDLGTATQPSGDVGGGSSGSVVRTIVGLAIVIAVIYGIAWVLRQVKQSRRERSIGGLLAVASVPLGSGRSLQLVRAGNELVLVGVGEHGVNPVRSYTEQEALDAGLIDEWGELIVPEELAGGGTPGGPAAASKLRSPRDVIESIRERTVRR